MKKTNSWVDYEERFNRIIHHIYEHLDDASLNLQTLADVAFLSPYHWHRTYQALRGETMVATVKRLRLHKAAGRLAHTALPIHKIAQAAGYPNVQSFTRIFKDVFGMPPGQFRKRGLYTPFQPQTKENLMHPVAIKTVPPMHAIAIDHTGSYMNIGKAFDALHARLGAQHLLEPHMRSIGIYCDDPSLVPEAQLRSQACAVLSKQISVEAPLHSIEIPGGPYAVLQYKGPYADMKSAYAWLYGHWLVQSGYQAGNAPVMEEYLNHPAHTAPAELRTDIYVPLAASDTKDATRPQL